MNRFISKLTWGGIVVTVLVLLPNSGQAAESTGDAAPATEPAKNPWEKSAALGLTLTSGNSDTILFTANALAAKKWSSYELSLGADGSYGESDDVKNAETLHGFGQLNYLFADRFFGYVRADALHDGIADVEYRVTLSPGVGYYIIKEKMTQLSVEAGPGFVMEKLGNKEKQYVTLRFAERFEHKFSDRARVWQSVEYLPQVDRFSNYIINAELGVEASLTEKIKLRAFAQDTYKNEPAPGREQNDLKLVTALAFTF